VQTPEDAEAEASEDDLWLITQATNQHGTITQVPKTNLLAVDVPLGPAMNEPLRQTLALR
jgi:hypothetical protein